MTGCRGMAFIPCIAPAVLCFFFFPRTPAAVLFSKAFGVYYDKPTRKSIECVLRGRNEQHISENETAAAAAAAAVH